MQPRPPAWRAALAAGAAAWLLRPDAAEASRLARRQRGATPASLGSDYVSVQFSAGNATNSTGVIGAGTTSSAKTMRPLPRVHFLFLAVDKVSNLVVWQTFFRDAPREQYRALIHCKLPSCEEQVKGSVLEVVPTVPSYYCTDLVSPMNQLLAVALNDGTFNAADKFAFVSDSTLPAKPFAHVYSTLSARQGSDFCVFPSNEWADVMGVDGKIELAVKHHQWITLARDHSERLLRDWQAGKLHNFMMYFHMNQDQYTYNNNSYADQRNFGCLDEFWHMIALYGPIGQVDSTQGRVVNLPEFSSGPLQVSSEAKWQGECDTFVVWAKYLHIPGDNPFERFHTMLDPVSVPHGGNYARPGWWDTISTVGLRAIRSSSFLFVRKFIDYPRLADGPNFAAAYEQIVFH